MIFIDRSSLGLSFTFLLQPLIRLYDIPDNTFDANNEDEDEDEEEEEEEEEAAGEEIETIPEEKSPEANAWNGFFFSYSWFHWFKPCEGDTVE